MCTGGDLCDYYKTNAFTTSEFCRIFLEFLSGITYIHERDIARK
jgi:serine/threonine protein kinase